MKIGATSSVKNKSKSFPVIIFKRRGVNAAPFCCNIVGCFLSRAKKRTDARSRWMYKESALNGKSLTEYLRKFLEE